MNPFGFGSPLNSVGSEGNGAQLSCTLSITYVTDLSPSSARLKWFSHTNLLGTQMNQGAGGSKSWCRVGARTCSPLPRSARRPAAAAGPACVPVRGRRVRGAWPAGGTASEAKARSRPPPGRNARGVQPAPRCAAWGSPSAPATEPACGKISNSSQKAKLKAKLQALGWKPRLKGKGLWQGGRQCLGRSAS